MTFEKISYKQSKPEKNAQWTKKSYVDWYLVEQPNQYSYNVD